MILVDNEGRKTELKCEPCEVKTWWYWTDVLGLAVAIVVASQIFM